MTTATSLVERRVDKLTFVIPVYKNWEMVPNCEMSLRKFYPEALVCLCPDEPRIKTPEFGGQWTERWMKQGLATGADIVIKLDPDMTVLGRSEFPDSDVFAELQLRPTKSQAVYVNGCAFGIKKVAIERVLESGFLRDPKYTDLWYAYKWWMTGEIVSTQDYIMMDIIERLGLTVRRWWAVEGEKQVLK